ncbi:gamma-aminobutyric acid type B receptor subunit 1-like [Exaiptasia diaphana]|uniref:G-protein coupled receptors family 3 profile domain-containing protein n=1 Tax=Exaiptasia diaphana TaxID=2652724 RepID=A0A913XU79_EXADI|nr:gamma-aminobutyric acid type B receptor subunit 1-like [Exaiptasia diaphana]
MKSSLYESGILLAVFAIFFTSSVPLCSSKQPLYIGCISPMTGKSDWWGRGIPVAAEMAFDMINNQSNILKDYELILLKNDSKGETGLGNRILFDYLNKKQVMMVLGPARSNVARSFADTSKYWQMVQISATATSGFLSRKKTYPYFLRTIPSASAMRTSFIALAKKFGWTRVSILFYYREMQVEYAWIINTPDKNGWWNRTYPSLKCTEKEITEAAQHAIMISDMSIGQQNTTGISRLTPDEFLTQYKQYSQERNAKTSPYGPFAFDAAWMIALALNKTFANKNRFSFFMDHTYYKDKTTALTIKNNVIQTQFMGATGFVHLDKKGDRYGHFSIMQIKDFDLRTVGTHDVYDNKVTLHPGKRFLWKVAVCCLSSVSVLLSLFFLYCNVAYRHKRFIKMSSPNINNLIISGCILAYISVILFAIDGKHLNSFICQARVFTLNIGFTLAFGSMFSKTWRVHRITRKLRTKQRRIKDVHLLAMVMAFLVADVITLVALTIISPITKDYHWFDSKPKSPTAADVIYRKKVAYCKIDHVLWLVIVYGTKTLLLVFGLFLAWETRKVKINALNDSQNTDI